MQRLTILVLLLLLNLIITRNTDMSDSQVQIFSEQLCPDSVYSNKSAYSEEVMILNPDKFQDSIIFIEKDDDKGYTRFVALDDHYYSRVDNCYYLKDKQHSIVQKIGNSQLVLDKTKITKYIRYEFDHHVENLMKSKGCDVNQVKTHNKLDLSMEQGVVSNDNGEDIFIIRFSRVEYFNSFMKSLPLQNSLDKVDMEGAFDNQTLCLNPLVAVSLTLNDGRSVLVEKLEVGISLKSKWKDTSIGYLNEFGDDLEKFMAFHKDLILKLAKMLKEGIIVEERPIEDSYIDVNEKIVFLFLKTYGSKDEANDLNDYYFSSDLEKFMEQNKPADVELPKQLILNYTYCMEHLYKEFGVELIEHEHTEELFGFIYNFFSKAMAKDSDFKEELKHLDKLLVEFKNIVIDKRDEQVVVKLEKSIKDKGSSIIGQGQPLNDIYDQFEYLFKSGVILTMSWIILSAF